MIELNKKTQQDFLNREWVQKLLDAGVDMSDAKYSLIILDNKEWVTTKEALESEHIIAHFVSADTPRFLPTYTVSELLYKLHEYIYPTIDGKEYSGPLILAKDAPFYMAYYKLRAKDYDRTELPDKQLDKFDIDYIYAEAEYPIESLASLLIQCHKKDIGLKTKDTGNISDK